MDLSEMTLKLDLNGTGIIIIKLTTSILSYLYYLGNDRCTIRIRAHFD